MKKLIETIKNIFSIEDLRVRILNTLGFLLVYRLGTFIVLPGINPGNLEEFTSQSQKGILGLLDMFAGGAFSNASIFALGIMPYISASIVMQLLAIAVPYFAKLQKEGEDGRKRINQYTRYLTILITAGQASGFVANLKYNYPGAIAVESSVFFVIICAVVLTAGTMFVLWLGEKITDKGIGNGVSMIIMIGIVSRLPISILAESSSKFTANKPLVFLIEIAVLFFTVMGVVLLTQGTRKIPVQYAKRIIGNKVYGGQRQYIPLKINAAGVMPIIFAQAIMFIPSIFASFFPEVSMVEMIGLTFSDHTSWQYSILFAILVILFTYFYTAIQINPNQMADDMKRNGGFIPGVKPGKKTSEFIDSILTRITLPGSIFLALVAVLPAFARMFGVTTEFAQFFGGTSLLILVGVLLDTLQQVESHLLMRHYDGLMKSGRIKGRTSIAA
ncbi:MAG: preprotein translocase subunit SecY [Bacteroidetes bacterium RIFCSPLOWO2_12_FULL_37_12]|nr:MAG: preprotein translocase subunit SecY [Bacteroidetes bacterium RIFCSPLOWO2_12_FULL_37_12]